MKKQLYISLLLLLSMATSAWSQSMIISGGGNHAIALCSKGQIYAWGKNTDNCLCLKDPTDAASDIVASPSLVNTGNLTFSMLSAGSGGHSVALSCNNIVYCWGANDYGQCGQPASKYVTGGQPLPVPCGEAPGYNLDGTSGGLYLGNIKYISATSGASLAILNDGTGRCVVWGGNESAVSGEFIQNPSETPVFIRDASGDPIKNIIHVAGGDNNILLIVGDSPDAKVGTVYSVGNWNGRGGDGATKSYIAAPVEIGDGTGTVSSGQYITNVRTSGLSDSGGFAVDGISGYVYGWGNNGWWGTCGLQMSYPASNIVYAEKVTAGEYESITGESYLTDALQVIGGNGSGTVVTKEGYVLYWGSNTGATAGGSSGGVIPNSSYKSEQNTQKLGPVFANYCAGENGYTVETRVDDAVAIARGDMFGFLVNDKGDFYVWGTTQLPGGSGDAGTLGTGKVSEISTCFKKIEISCTPQDLCPEAFMTSPRYKCPGVMDSLYSGFTPLKNSEDSYYYQWSKDGQVLNASLSTSSLADRKADKYNVPTIGVLEPGLYRVDITYVGLNVPCDNCPATFAEVEVIDMEMPVDTTIITSCVAQPLTPSVSDQICYDFTVNSKFYASGKKTTWVVYNDKENGSPLDTLDVLVGGTGSFCVNGSNVKVNDNNPIDTTYSIWIEDATKEEAFLLEDAKIAAGETPATYVTKDMSAQASCFVTFKSMSDFALGSFSLALQGNGQAVTDLEITATVYSTSLCSSGGNVEYIPAAQVASVSKTIATLGTTPEIITLDFEGLSLPVNKVRGTSYILVVSVNKQVKALTKEVSPGVSILNDAITLVEGGLDYNAIPVCYSNNNSTFSLFNLEFFKLTEYTCGRIELQSRYWCPPCNRPDAKTSGKYVEIESTQAPVADTIRLCKESTDVTLSVSDVKNTTVTDATFDILWFGSEADMVDDANAIQSELAGTATTSSLSVKWSDIPEGTTKTYYVKVRDHEKSTAAACFVFDSVKVKANEEPVVPDVTIDPFCEGSLSSTELAALVAKFSFTGYSAQVKNAAGTDLTSALLLAELSTLTAGTHTYSVVLTDLETGCVSQSKDITFEVWANPTEALTPTADFCEGVATALPTSANSYTVTWYNDKLGSGLADQNLTGLSGKLTPYEYYYTVTDANGCIGDTTLYSFTVKPTAKAEIAVAYDCDKTTLTVTTTPADATLTWTIDGGASAVTSNPLEIDGITYKAGEYSVVASATGYCDSKPDTETAKYYETPDKISITVADYLKNDGTPDYTKIDAAASAAKDADAEVSVYWSAPVGPTSTDESSTQTAPTSGYTTTRQDPTPNLTSTDDEFFYYWIYQERKNGDVECKSDPTIVVVPILGAPSPIVHDTVYCQNSANVAAISENVTVNQAKAGVDYELVWYDGVSSSTIPSTSTVGTTTYTVAQKEIGTTNESAKRTFTVTILGVDKPNVVDNTLAYCANATAAPVSAKKVEDNSAYYYADAFMWSVDGGTESATAPTPNTNVTTTATYEYSVYQTYTIPTTGEVCKGDPSTFKVKVTKVDTLVTKDVLYLKADAVNNTFAKNIMEQSSDAVTGQVAGSSINWYESDCTTPIVGTPTPTVDASTPEGTDQKITYCVSQTVDGCESEKTTITVTISDSPMPSVSDVTYCEGATATALKATINELVEAAGNYTLNWYSSDATGAIDLSTKSTTAPTPSTLIADAASTSESTAYYVTQQHNTKGAESSPAKITVTVYANPVITGVDPDPVCEKAVDISAAWKMTNNATASTAKFYSDATATTELSSSSVNKQGKNIYYIQASFSLPNSTGGEYCKSNIAPLNVDIQDLSEPVIAGPTSVCPGKTVTLTAVSTSTNPGVVTYEWGSDATGTGNSYTSAALSMTTGTKYNHTVTAKAGSCTKTTATAYVVTVGDGQVVGTMSIAEADNTGAPLTFDGDVSREFYSCGGAVTLTAAYTNTGSDDYVWYDGTTQLGTGALLTIPATTAAATKTYTLKYTNECEATAEITVHTIPLTATPTETTLETMCEGSVFSTGVNVVCSETAKIQWYKGTAMIGGATQSTFTISSVKDADDGQYSYEVTNRGCKATGDAASLDAQPYIKVTNQTDPYVVPRNGNQSISLNITVPTSGTVDKVEWKENGSSVFTGNPYSVTGVVSDHTYSIELTDPNYCSATTTATIWVDAELQLSATLTDTMCYGETKVLTIDTTGTGAFRQSGVYPTLSITETTGGTVRDITSKIKKNGTLLEVELSPAETSTYMISFIYGSQKQEWSQRMVVLQPIKLTVPTTPTICEGEEATLEVTNISPEGTTISWNSDPTITSSLTGETVTVAPTYQGSASGSHQSTYTYTFVANFPRCETKSYTANVKVDEPLSGEITGDSLACEGESSLLDASSYQASTYSWSSQTESETGATSTLRITPAATAVYRVDMTRGKCSTYDEFNMIISTNPVIVRVDSVGLRDRDIILEEGRGTAPFTYQVDNEAGDLLSTKHDLAFSMHLAKVVDNAGCSATYSFEVTPPEISIPDWFTPNADGTNDSWVIPSLSEIYPNAVVSIYDRYGKLLMQFLGDNADGWNGKYLDVDMPSTDYWYQIDIEEINKQYVGHFTLIRR